MENHTSFFLFFFCFFFFFGKASKNKRNMITTINDLVIEQNVYRNWYMGGFSSFIFQVLIFKMLLYLPEEAFDCV